MELAIDLPLVTQEIENSSLLGRILVRTAVLLPGGEVLEVVAALQAERHDCNLVVYSRLPLQAASTQA